MYYVCLNLQIISIIAAFICCYLILVRWNSKSHSYLFLSAVAILVNNIGYLVEIGTDNVEIMLIGTKLAYLGRPLVALGMLLFTAEFCRVVIPRIVKLLLMVYSLFITILVFISQYHTLFYTGHEYVDSGIFPHIIYGHGPVYYVYMVSNFLYFAFICFITIRRIRQTKSKIESEQIVYIFLMSAVVIFGLALMITGVSNGYDTTQPAYLICAIIFMVSLYRCDIMETIELVKDYVVDNLDEGVVALSNHNNGEIIFFNPMATKILPGLTEKTRHLSELDPNPLTNEVVFCGDKVYKTELTDVVRGKKNAGKMLVLIDVTSEYNYASVLEDEVNKKTEDIARIQSAVIVGIADVVEARDGYTGEHIKNTQNYVRIIVNALKELPEYSDIVDEDYAKRVIDAAPLHDIGKISVPDYILTKPDRLLPEEFETIKQHSEDGANIIRQTLIDVEDDNYLSTAFDIAMYHHEKWDGSGYPAGLVKEEIPLSARIMAVADVYDALRCKRSYKESMSYEQAKEIMMAGRNSHFDGRLVDIFFDCLERNGVNSIN